MSGLRTRSASPLPFRPGAVPPLAPLPGTARRAGRRHVLDQELFRDAIVRERKRADRFDQTFLLLQVSLKNISAQDRESVCAAAMEALWAIRRPVDVLGWFATGSILALLMPEIRVSHAAARGEVIRALERVLARRLDASVIAKLPIRVRVQTGSDATRRQAGFRPERLAIKGRGQKAQVLLRDGTKRTLDIGASSLLLLLMAPLFLLIALAVKLTSPGPVLFRQERVGQTGERFRMLKFRTMHVDADKTLHQQYVTQFIKANGAASGSGVEAVFKIVDDPRITRVGHFLRKSSLDELPQFWNVLRGDMSLVGPRPPLPYEVEEYRHWHHRRVLEAKPGITGLWQVVGRSRTTFDEMVRLDLRYARTRSLWLDVRILLATPRAVISGKGAC